MTKLELYRNNNKPARVLYVQMRQATRDEKGRLKVTATKSRTFRNATIKQMEEILEKAGRQ